MAEFVYYAFRSCGPRPGPLSGTLPAGCVPGTRLAAERRPEAEEYVRAIAAGGRPPQAALVALANAYLDVGEPGCARRLAREAADGATLGDWSDNMVEVVMVLHAVGERSRAASIMAALMADSTPKALRLLARIHARTGVPDAALATAQQARELEPDPTLDNTLAGDIAESLERDGYSDWADAAAETVSGKQERDRIRHRQIRAAVAAGHLDRAVGLAALTIGTHGSDSDAVNDLAATLVAHGRTDTALRVARDRRDFMKKALRHVAVAMAESGDAAQAEELAAEIPDGWGADARRMVAAATARYGDHATARAVADRIAVGHTRGLAYSDLAVELQTAGQHLEARRTMAEALCAATWPEPDCPAQHDRPQRSPRPRRRRTGRAIRHSTHPIQSGVAVVKISPPLGRVR